VLGEINERYYESIHLFLELGGVLMIGTAPREPCTAKRAGFKASIHAARNPPRKQACSSHPLAAPLADRDCESEQAALASAAESTPSGRKQSGWTDAIPSPR
jgi:hypothetical protein